jgi:hypothetical protein
VSGPSRGVHTAAHHGPTEVAVLAAESEERCFRREAMRTGAQKRPIGREVASARVSVLHADRALSCAHD